MKNIIIIIVNISFFIVALVVPIIFLILNLVFNMNIYVYFNYWFISMLIFFFIDTFFPHNLLSKILRMKPTN